jgi:hypothetical protein
LLGCGVTPWPSPPPDWADIPTLPETIDLDAGDYDDVLLTPSAVGSSEPDVIVSAEPVFCCNPLSVDFSAEVPDISSQTRVVYSWDFGDGKTSQGRSVRHTYAWPGEYPVTVTAKLPDGRTITAARTLKLTPDGTLPDGWTSDSEGTPDAGSAPENSSGDGPDGNPALTVDAGPDQSVYPGEIVTLQAVAAAAAPVALMVYQWSQTGGTPVELDEPRSSRVRFEAPSAPNGVEALTFLVRVSVDGVAATDDVQVFVEPSEGLFAENRPPVVAAQQMSVAENQPVLLTLRGSDADGDDLTFSIVIPPARGSLGPPDNRPVDSATVLYTPPPGYAGIETFSFQAADGKAVSGVVRFTVMIASPIPAATVGDGEYLVATGRPGELALETIEGGDVVVRFEITLPPAHGTLGPIQALSPSRAVVVYSPDSEFFGEDSFRYRAASEGGASNEGTIRLQVRSLVIPWMEVNYPTSDAARLFGPESGAQPGMSSLDYCLAGLESWASVTDTVIITTAPNAIDALYPPLMARKPPHLNIIGGIKTYTLPGAWLEDTRPYDFADAEEWRRITERLERISEWTGNNIVVLENETTLQPFNRGEKSIDIARLYHALKPLNDSGLVTWSWVPWILLDNPAFPSREMETTRLVATMAGALPRNKFMVDFDSWYESQDWDRVGREKMNRLVRPERVQDGFFVTPSGWMAPSGIPKRCFNPAEAIARIETVRKDLIRVYPGGVYWLSVAREFARLSPPFAQPPER